MKAENVIGQLQAILPSVTSLFTDDIALSSLTYASGVVTAVSSAAHNLSTNRYVNILNANNPIAITSITRSGTIATVVTTTDHDLTYSASDARRDDKTVELTGSTEAEFNGTFKLTGSDNRRTFTFEIADAGPTSATGTPLLQDGAKLPGFNGRHQITVVDDTSFTYPVSQVLFATAGGTPLARTSARVSGAATLERAEDAYTEQASEKLWGFVVLGDVIASKNRNVNSDMTDTASKTTAWNQRIMQPFSVYVFTPTAQNDGAGRIARDLMEDVSLYLFKSLVGVKFPTGYFAEQYVCTFVNHGFSAYNTAYYVHEFNFEMAADLTFDDTVGYDNDVAFRDVDLTIVNKEGTQVEEATVTANLDEVPLP